MIKMLANMHFFAYFVLFAVIHTSQSENENMLRSTEEEHEFHSLMKTIFKDTNSSPDVNFALEEKKNEEDLQTEKLENEHRKVESVKLANDLIHSLTAQGKLKLGTLILNLKRIVHKNEERNTNVKMQINDWDDNKIKTQLNEYSENDERYNNFPMDLKWQGGVDRIDDIKTDSDFLIKNKWNDIKANVAPIKDENIKPKMNQMPYWDGKNVNFERDADKNKKEHKAKKENTEYWMKNGAGSEVKTREVKTQLNPIEEQAKQKLWYKINGNDFLIRDDVYEITNPEISTKQKGMDTYRDINERYNDRMIHNTEADDSLDDVKINNDFKAPVIRNSEAGAFNYKNGNDFRYNNEKAKPKTQENSNWAGRKLQSIYNEHKTQTDTKYEEDPNRQESENNAEILKNQFEEKMQELHLKTIKNHLKYTDKPSLALHIIDKYIELLTATRYEILSIYENYYSMGDDILRRNWSFMQDKVLSDGEEEKANLLKLLCEREVVCKVYPAFSDHMADFMDVIMYLPDDNMELVFKALLSQSQDLDFFIKLFFPDTSKGITRKVMSLENNLVNSKYILQVAILFISNKHKIFNSGDQALDAKVKALRILMDIIDQVFVNEAIEITFGDLKIGIEKWIGDPTTEKLHQPLRTFLTHLRVVLESRLSDVAKHEIKFLTAFVESGETNEVVNSILKNGSRYIKPTPF